MWKGDWAASEGLVGGPAVRLVEEAVPFAVAFVEGVPPLVAAVVVALRAVEQIAGAAVFVRVSVEEAVAV